MTSLGRAFIAALGAVAVAGSLAFGATSQEASGWSQGHRSRVRLIDGGPARDREGRMAGIEIGLDPGFKTYWRNPGDSGLPPAFDWSGSSNVAAVEVLWPAPARFEDASGVSYGYSGSVVLPVRITARDAREAVGLRLRLDYGVCKEICIPAQAELEMSIRPDGSGAFEPQVAAALARVPTPKPIGTEGELAILGVEPVATGDKPALSVTMRGPPKASLFVEAPDGWFLLARQDGDPAPLPQAEARASRNVLVDILERPRDAKGAIELRFTLASGDRAIETVASLDSARLPR